MPVAPISEITVQEDRFGGESRLDDIDLLAKSIEKYGLMQPIVVDDSLNLVAGFRRLMAHISLDREEIEVKYHGELSEVERRVLELEENVQRMNLEWADEQRAIAEIHKLRQELDPDWSWRDTANAVGKSRQSVYNAQTVAEEMDKDPEIEKSTTLTGALRKIKQKRDFEKRQKAVERKKQGKGPEVPAEIQQGDCRDLFQLLEKGSVDAVITNFPFGVDLKLGHEGREVYEDDEDYITDLVMEVVPECHRVLRDGGWFVGFFDVKKITYNRHMERVYNAIAPAVDGEMRQVLERMMGLTWWLEEAGFDYVSTLPAMWGKPNKTQGLIGDPDKGLISAYEAFVFAAKGDAKLRRSGLQNLWLYDTPPSGKRVHPLQMSEDLCTDLVSLVCIGGETVLDPFAGSGSVGLGALNNQCEFIGFELDPDLAKRGNMLLGEHIYAAAS